MPSTPWFRNGGKRSWLGWVGAPMKRTGTGICCGPNRTIPSLELRMAWAGPGWKALGRSSVAVHIAPEFQTSGEGLFVSVCVRGEIE